MREATEKEYQLVVSKYGRSKRQMQAGRAFDVIWSDGRGTEIAQKTEILSRGKVQKVHYLVNPDFLPGPGKTAGRLDGVRGHKLMTSEVRRRLPPLYSQENVRDPIVQVKYFSPYTGSVWLVTEYDGRDTMFGWADRGFGGELGYVSLQELEHANRQGLPLVERDLYFKPVPLSQAKQQERRASVARVASRWLAQTSR